MEEIENINQWNQYTDEISNDLKKLISSINERNRLISDGTPEQTLTRQHLEIKRSLKEIERLKIVICFLLLIPFYL